MSKKPREIKAKIYQAAARKQDNSLVNTPPPDNYQPLFKRLNSEFPPKNYRIDG